MTMTEDKVAKYKEMIRAERRRVLKNIDALHDEPGTLLHDAKDDDEFESQMGDMATTTFLRERDHVVEEHEEHLLNEIDRALAAINNGTYGICEGCSEQIVDERLEALPWATRCTDCQKKFDA